MLKGKVRAWLSHWNEVQATPSHAAVPPHFTSQPHELPQSTPRHDIEPLHTTSHLPVPHSSVRHEFDPEQVIVQAWGPVQVTPLRHELVTLHATSQFQPTGHTTWALQLVTAQSILQVWPPKSQVVHWGGQTLLLPSVPSVVGPSPLGASTVPPGSTQ